MDDSVKNLTLVLLYLTSWKENDLYGDDMRRSWKGYPFDVINELTEMDFIRGSFRSKSVFLTEAGINEAEKLMEKYLGDKDDNMTD